MGQLVAWSWSGRDRISLTDLEMVVAVARQADLKVVRDRLHLPKGDFGFRRLKATSEVAANALAEPGLLWWRELADWAAPGWSDEAALEALRRTPRFFSSHQ